MNTDQPNPEYKSVIELLKWNNVKTYRETRGGLIAIHKRRLGLWLYFAWTNARGGGYYQSGSQEHFTNEDGTK